jgi:hypothetical protein
MNEQPKPIEPKAAAAAPQARVPKVGDRVL